MSAVVWRAAKRSLLAAAVLTTPFAIQAQSYDDLAGGWVVTSWTAPDGEVVESPQPGLFLFTAEGQYSFMYVTGSEPRPVVGPEPSDAALAGAFRTIIANSGRYRLNGDEIAYEAFVAKSPDYMADWDPENGGNLQTLKRSIAGSVLTLEWPNGRKATLSRPAGIAGDGGL